MASYVVRKRLMALAISLCLIFGCKLTNKTLQDDPKSLSLTPTEKSREYYKLKAACFAAYDNAAYGEVIERLNGMFKIYDGNYQDHYYMAQALVHLKKYDEAVKHILIGDSLGVYLFNHLSFKKHPNIDEFKKSTSATYAGPMFKKNYAQRYSELIFEYIDALQPLYESDQEYRSKSDSFDFYREKIRITDIQNQRSLDSLVDLYGFPTLRRVGAMGSDAAFLIIQHGGEEYRMKYKDSLDYFVRTGNFAKKGYALFIDRFLMDQGKPQLYGSQIYSSQETNHEQTLWPIEKPCEVNWRRLQMNLEPLEDYLAFFGMKYEVEQCK